MGGFSQDANPLKRPLEDFDELDPVESEDDIEEEEEIIDDESDEDEFKPEEPEPAAEPPKKKRKYNKKPKVDPFLIQLPSGATFHLKTSPAQDINAEVQQALVTRLTEMIEADQKKPRGKGGGKGGAAENIVEKPITEAKLRALRTKVLASFKKHLKKVKFFGEEDSREAKSEVDMSLAEFQALLGQHGDTEPGKATSKVIKKSFTSAQLHSALDVSREDDVFVGACWRAGSMLRGKGWKQGSFALDIEHARCDYSQMNKKLKIWAQFSCKDPDAAINEGLVGGGGNRGRRSFGMMFF